MSRQNLAEKYPHLTEKWDSKLNRENFFTIKITLEKYWWYCNKGNHSFFNTVYRALTNSCGVCHGKQIVVGYNDFATKASKKLLEEWHPKKNLIKPTEITQGSDKQIWWLCEQGHEWRAEAGRRLSRGDRCPHCNNKTLTVGHNDLKTYCSKKENLKHLFEEWHPNNPPMNSFTARASKKVRWHCEKGHEWLALISNRTAGDGCFQCHRSQGEKDLANWLKNLTKLSIIENDQTIIKPKELDLYIPSLAIALEYNGDYWHSEARNGSLKNLEKVNLCARKKIKLVFVWESDWEENRDKVKNALILFINKGQESEILQQLKAPKA